MMSKMENDFTKSSANETPKRILTIDGGGIRGTIAIQFLRQIENFVCKRKDINRLSDYFHLIGGTSTGSIIAALLAVGKSVDEIEKLYLNFAETIFKRRWLGRVAGGIIAARFSKSKFRDLIGRVLGDIRLGDPKIRTGLMIVTRRVDTGSPWVVSNNPQGKFYSNVDGQFFPNQELRLDQLVLASCSAPTFFVPEKIEVGKRVDGRREIGVFVDGGCSPYNNPALLAFRLATVSGYRYNWPTGEDNLELVSVGTGRIAHRFRESKLTPAAIFGVKSLRALMDDCSNEVELMMQWLSNSATTRSIDAEVGNLSDDTLAPQPLLKYLRYNTELSAANLSSLLGEAIDERTTASLRELDRVDLIPMYVRIGKAAAAIEVSEVHF